MNRKTKPKTMTKTYKVGFFAQKVQETQPGVRETVTSSMTFLPEDFPTPRAAQEFIDEKEESLPVDEYDRFFIVLETRKSKSKKLTITVTNNE